ncbi:MAG: NifU family protein [Bdellovibrionales bacterium]|nr:NifU family protein [Ramlibacter sp.]
MSDAPTPGLARADQPVSIRAEASLADPDSCKFTLTFMSPDDTLGHESYLTSNRSLHPGGPWFFAGPEAAAGSPLGERLFALGGVASVLIAGNVVTIGKAPGAAWTGLKAAVGAAIRAQLLSGLPAILETAAPGGTPARSDAELGIAVQELLDREVNRSIANHGGKISLVHVQEGRLFITMSGGCQGCASSQVTLRQGFEVMVKRVAPEITAIVDATDHAAGRQPFYPRAAPGVPSAA